ncbi:DEAD/DEAH box helicase [Spirosoma sp. KCTC 42546]|uniref:DEAD/DEAH box helicase n=1 Tax=Spirosoma sp. KCTC 42546 TaxID=2520506 RepID=UPI0011570A53|nr:DEAD/DEAH box helicase [Spirosoma sp. KCTC 42546]QDK78756.1 DEAD/DEAH box helicase [Spirosoma sp. KCTC 42546]
MAQSLFDQFRRHPTTSQFAPAAKVEALRVQICFDADGSYLRIVNERGEVVEPDYQGYSGALRNLLRAMQQLRERNGFVIDWENPSAELYLHQYDYLLDYVRHCPVVVDERNKPITFVNFSDASSLGELRLQIKSNAEDGATDKPTAETLEASVRLFVDGQYEADFLLINERNVLSAGRVVEISEVGPAFNRVPLFDTSLAVSDLTKYLSLALSNLDNVLVEYEDYRLLTTGTEPIMAQPCLIFEKIDADQSLYVRVTQQLPQTDAGFLDEFDLYRYADINPLERTISIRIVERQSLNRLIDTVSQLIEKHTVKEKGRRKSQGQYIVEGNLFVLPQDVAGAFIYQELPQLLETFQLFGAEKLKQYRISTYPPRLNLNLSHGIDFLEGDATVSFGEQQLGLLDVIRQYNQQRYVQLSDSSHALVNETYIRKLERLFQKSKKDKVKLSFFDLPLAEGLLDEAVADATFKKSRAFFAGFNELADKKPRLAAVNATLRPYQKRGVQWLEHLHDYQLNGCLADDMGLGKTLQTITLLSRFYPKESLPTLVVMPKSLLFNWQKEVERFNPQLTTYTYYADHRDLDVACEHQLIFTTYALLRNDIEKFRERAFFYVILDESQNIKNLQSQASRAVVLLQAKHRLALSGTPIENNLSELYSLFRFLNPAMFGSAEQFGHNYLTPIQKHNDPDVIDELRKKIYPFVLRRLKKNVLTELPDKIEQVLYIEMSDVQRRFYEQRRQFYKENIEKQIAEKGLEQSQFFVFQAFNELRQIASIPEAKSGGNIESPKIEMLVEQLTDAAANGHKMLVFVNYLAALERIGEQLDAQGIDYVSMSGSTRDRQRLVERFQTDSTCKVFLMTLKTGGTGLNLTAADMVFIFDPWWNKAAENQAIDRSHRIGQNRKVMAYKMITQGTIEEKIMELQQKKAELFNAVISADASALKSFSESDITFMLE